MVAENTTFHLNCNRNRPTMSFLRGQVWWHGIYGRAISNIMISSPYPDSLQ